MAEHPALPLWTDAYIGDTAHLSLEQHGAYLKLLMFAWRRRDCALPDDDRQLANVVGVSTRQWRKLKPVVMAFWDEMAAGWVNARAAAEIGNADRRIAPRPTRRKHRSRPKRKAGRTRRGALRPSDRFRILQRDRFRCQYCGRAAPDVDLHVDHVVPVARGGGNDDENLVTACQECNLGKGKSPLVDGDAR